MKNFQLKKDSAWVEVLSNEVNEVSEEKAEVLNSFYGTIKPILSESDVYELIALDLVESDESKYLGILNCRVNGEHKQIRF